MMRIDSVLRCFPTALVVGALAFAAASDSQAQLFGQRSAGRSTPSQGQPSGAAAARAAPLESVGLMVDEQARYIRGNRQAGAFVGRDADDTAAFVGSQQAGADVELRSAIDELAIETLPDQNQLQTPPMPPRTMLYAPRLRVDFTYASRSEPELSNDLVRRLQTSLGLTDPRGVQVAIDEGVAVLRGQVPSDRARKLAEHLVRFEPGITRVRNELQLSTAPPALPALLGR